MSSCHNYSAFGNIAKVRWFGILFNEAYVGIKKVIQLFWNNKIIIRIFNDWVICLNLIGPYSCISCKPLYSKLSLVYLLLFFAFLESLSQTHVFQVQGWENFGELNLFFVGFTCLDVFVSSGCSHSSRSIPLFPTNSSRSMPLFPTN